MSNEYRTTWDILEKIAKLIYNHSGISFLNNHLKVLDARIQEYTTKNFITDQELLSRLTLDQDMLFEFVGFVTTNHTLFFRSIEQFNVLGEKVLPELIEKNKYMRHIRIWSAACSSGEEPYSLALYLQKYFDMRSELSNWSFSILATDIDTASLSKAEKGEYPYQMIKHIPQEYHDYLDITADYMDGYLPVEGTIKIPTPIKSMINFKIHNLIQSNAYRNYDIIFCRNVLIYFDTATQEKVVNYLAESLSKDRYLFISPSETLLGMDTDFTAVVGSKAIYYINKEEKTSK